MNILLNNESVAVFFGSFTVMPDCIDLGVGTNWDYNASNTTVIDAEPPNPVLPNLWKWENGAWTCIDQAALDAYLQEQKDQFNAGQKQKRHAAYVIESDPIFFKSQRGEATQQQWLDAIAAIDARFPYMT